MNFSWKLVIVFSVFAIILLSGCNQQNSAEATEILTDNAQKVSVRALNTGFYDKLEVRVKAGMPVELSFSADPDSGCGRELMIPEFGVDLLSKNGETKTATFTPQKAGAYGYFCGMRMFNGKLIVE